MPVNHHPPTPQVRIQRCVSGFSTLHRHPSVFVDPAGPRRRRTSPRNLCPLQKGGRGGAERFLGGTVDGTAEQKSALAQTYVPVALRAVGRSVWSGRPLITCRVNELLTLFANSKHSTPSAVSPSRLERSDRPEVAIPTRGLKGSGRQCMSTPGLGKPGRRTGAIPAIAASRANGERRIHGVPTLAEHFAGYLFGLSNPAQRNARLVQPVQFRVGLSSFGNRGSYRTGMIRVDPDHFFAPAG